MKFFIGMLAFCTCLSFNLLAQDSLEVKFNKKYLENIQKSRINGVYIPRDMDDACKELTELSSEESIEKFKNAEEMMVVQKLHFGLGRWMIYNWNFYDGSRFSHYLKEKGLSHPDDMAKFVMICYHRMLNEKDPEEEYLIKKITDERKQYLMENEILWRPGIKRDTLEIGNQ